MTLGLSGAGEPQVGRDAAAPVALRLSRSVRAIDVYRSALNVKIWDVDASDGLSDKQGSLMNAAAEAAAAAVASVFKGRTGRQHQTGLGRPFLAWLFAAPPRPRSPLSRLPAGVFRERRSQGGKSRRKNTDAGSARSFMQLRFPWPSTQTPPPD
ncbi:hypothetical protein QQF64_000462 [Cirrhinus molitorella]|uniref:Uncharacterized protein n=1 Tax=Cirrhinus molitorella TaxID=172907 RepID=A0ABR3NXL0_9TELE